MPEASESAQKLGYLLVSAFSVPDGSFSVSWKHTLQQQLKRFSRPRGRGNPFRAPSSPPAPAAAPRLSAHPALLLKNRPGGRRDESPPNLQLRRAGRAGPARRGCGGPRGEGRAPGGERAEWAGRGARSLGGGGGDLGAGRAGRRGSRRRRGTGPLGREGTGAGGAGAGVPRGIPRGFRETRLEPVRLQVSLCEATVCPRAETATVKPLRNTFKKLSPPGSGEGRPAGRGGRGRTHADRASLAFGRGTRGDRAERGRWRSNRGGHAGRFSFTCRVFGPQGEPRGRDSTGPRPQEPAAERTRLPSGPPVLGSRAGRPAAPVVEFQPLSPPRSARREPPGPAPQPVDPGPRCWLTRDSRTGRLRSPLSVRRCSAPAARAPESRRRGGAPGRRP